MKGRISERGKAFCQIRVHRFETTIAIVLKDGSDSFCRIFGKFTEKFYDVVQGYLLLAEKDLPHGNDRLE